ncbi:MAG: hypothetical protein ACLR10_06720 [Oscillospiraceae bacterium]
MRKILCRALLCLCLVLALAPVPAAYAQDLDRIESYDVDVTPDTQDGSLRIQVTLGVDGAGGGARQLGEDRRAQRQHPGGDGPDGQH